MKKLLLDRKVQKAFLPLSVICILPIWLMLRGGGEPAPPVYIMAALGVFFLVLDRIFKPRELERAEKKLQKDLKP